VPTAFEGGNSIPVSLWETGVTANLQKQAGRVEHADVPTDDKRREEELSVLAISTPP